jgi:hypothetical protein
MASSKGETLEELTREFFFQKGYYSLRSVPFRAYSNDVTDIDVWSYRRSGAGKSRLVVDVKSKRAPKAFERVLWVKGLQSAVGADRAMIATSDTSEAASRFAMDHSVDLITRSTVSTPENIKHLQNRFSLEGWNEALRSYDFHKSDGDWTTRIAESKASLIGASGFTAFNRVMNHFRFFAERVYTRPQQRDVAVRCTLLTAGIACVALDQALEPVQFATADVREEYIRFGVSYGDTNSNRTRGMISRILKLVATSVENGDVVRRQIEKSLEAQIESLRADIVSEYFSNEFRSSELVDSARTFDALAFGLAQPDIAALPSVAKATIGIFADFSSIPRPRLFRPDEVGTGPTKVDDVPLTEPKLL